MKPDARIFVAGHRGLVGSAICRALDDRGFDNVVTRTHDELDLRDASEVDAFFRVERPEYVILAAAKVGGIQANDSYPVEFLRDNLEIQTHVIDAAHRHHVSKLAFLGSSCIYPRLAPQPISEDSLMTGPLESTNEWYAIAKIAGIRLCQAYSKQHGFNTISIMPTNLYGPGDNFDLDTSHVLPALIRDAAYSSSPPLASCSHCRRQSTHAIFPWHPTRLLPCATLQKLRVLFVSAS
jgi:GDP-L-fucose synthase